MSDIVSAALAKENIDITEENQQPEVPVETPTVEKTVEKELPTETAPASKPAPDSNTNQEDTNSQDAENQIAAVLTEMQNANNGSVATAEKTSGESNQENLEPSIAVIMQDESAPAAPENTSNEGQVSCLC